MAVVTAARRGELVAMRWTDIRWREADLLIARGYVSHRGQRVIKDTKTHQKRRLSLDLATIDVLRRTSGAGRRSARRPGFRSVRMATSSHVTGSETSRGSPTR